MTENPDWLQWGRDQLIGLFFIQLVIVLLMVGLEILRLLGIEKIIHRLMSPFLKLLKIGNRMLLVCLIIVGMLNFQT